MQGGGADLDAVRAMAEPIAAAHGVRVVDVEYRAEQAGCILRVTIERAQPLSDRAAGPSSGGVSIDDCVRVSRDLSTALDVDGPIAHHYNLEVSSPGVERRLQTADDFRRQVGKLLKVKLARPAADGQRVLRGTLLGVAAEQLCMEVDGRTHEVALADVQEARLVFEFGRASTGPRSAGAGPVGKKTGRARHKTKAARAGRR